MFKQRTLYMIISLIWSVHQWTRLCPRLLSTSWNKTDKMIWIFHGYIQIDISVLHTPSVYRSQDISLSIYDDDFMFVIRYPKDSLLQLYTSARNIQLVHETTKKIPQLLSLTQKESRKNLFLLDFILVAWKTEQAFTWGYLL